MPRKERNQNGGSLCSALLTVLLEKKAGGRRLQKIRSADCPKRNGAEFKLFFFLPQIRQDVIQKAGAVIHSRLKT